MTSKTTDILERLDALLRRYSDMLGDCLRKGEQQNDPQAAMMLAGLRHGTHTLNAIRILLLSDSQYASCAASLARGIFEASIRLLWATRTLRGAHDHWERLQKYWALEDKKWANQARRFPQSRAHADKVEQARRDILDNKIEPAPPIDKMLREIEEADRQQGLMEGDTIAEFTYDNCYRMLCRASHANPAASNPAAISDLIGQTRMASLLATNWYCQAICHIAIPDTKAGVESVVRQILHIAGSNYEKRE